jgi:hypothetical protein
MGTIPDIIRVMAAHQVDKEPTLRLFARSLSAAGKLSEPRPGPGGTLATLRDAARLLIAVAATDKPRDAARCVDVFGGMVWESAMVREGARQWLRQEDEPTLERGLAAALGALGAGEVHRYNEIVLRAENERPTVPAIVFKTPPVVQFDLSRNGSGAAINICGATVRYIHPLLAAQFNKTYDEALVLSEEYERATADFRTGKSLRAFLDEPLLTAVARAVHVRPFK